MTMFGDELELTTNREATAAAVKKTERCIIMMRYAKGGQPTVMIGMISRSLCLVSQNKSRTKAEQEQKQKKKKKEKCRHAVGQFY